MLSDFLLLRSIRMIQPAYGTHEVLDHVEHGLWTASCHVLPAGRRQAGSVQQLVEDIDPDLDLMPGQV